MSARMTKEKGGTLLISFHYMDQGKVTHKAVWLEAEAGSCSNQCHYRNLLDFVMHVQDVVTVIPQETSFRGSTTT